MTAIRAITALLTAATVLTGLSAGAQTPSSEAVFDTRTGAWLTVTELAMKIARDTIVVLGEQHVTTSNQNETETILHHANQRRWLQTLKNVNPFPVQLGMEFLPYPAQPAVNAFLAGATTEAEFLLAVDWGHNPFTPYRALMLESAAPQLGTLALNTPRDMSTQVAHGGPDSLSTDQRTLLPPIWEQGSAPYFERFRAAMGGHVSQAELDNYFWAQSLWDDTMAWKATSRPGLGPLTIVVGEFHAEFGHGLPARLKRYGATDVRTLIQIAVDPGTAFNDAVKPDPVYGDRADYIWVFTRSPLARILD